ncbi:MAG: response regulator [Nitrospirae bacterium]|nr:MAG: response regulator [Nitrospirota bacterium]
MDRADNPLPTGTILLVEEDLQVRDVIREFLTGAGYRVLEAEDGPKALALSEQYAGPIHLLITDDITPCMSGPALAARLAHFHPHLQRIFMLDYVDDQLLREMEATGCRILQIPFSREALLGKVRDLLGKPLQDNG